MSCQFMFTFRLNAWSHYFILFFFFFNDTATTEIYTLSLHDALPISRRAGNQGANQDRRCYHRRRARSGRRTADRKSTRLNSSHSQISYAVFCLKKKKKIPEIDLSNTKYHYQLQTHYVMNSLPILQHH